jgi:hypothetical protein
VSERRGWEAGGYLSLTYKHVRVGEQFDVYCHKSEQRFWLDGPAAKSK